MNLKTNPELLPLVEWWEKDGKQTVIWVAVAAIAVAGWYGWKNHRAARLEAASDALVSAYTTEELEESVSKFSGMAAQGPIKIRLAKSYYDAGRYEEAMTVYDELAAKGGDMTEQEGVLDKADELARKCLEMGCGAALVKCGLSGMVYRTAGAERIARIGPRLELDAEAWKDRAGRQPCYRAEIVRSATGAGDVSIAAYLTAVIGGESPADCAKLAAAEGAASVSSYDALGGVLPLDELKKRIAKAENAEERTCL